MTQQTIDTTDPIQKYLESISMTPNDYVNYRIVQALLKSHNLTLEQLEIKHMIFIAEQRRYFGSQGTLQNPLAEWRLIWNSRNMIHRADTYAQAEKWVAKNQVNYDKPLKIDCHPKDLQVVYTERDIIEENLGRSCDI